MDCRISSHAPILTRQLLKFIPTPITLAGTMPIARWSVLSPILLVAAIVPVLAQAPAAPATPTQAPQPAPAPARLTPPTRDPHTPGYVAAKELPDGTLPPSDADGNFIVGPTHTPAPETVAQDG